MSSESGLDPPLIYMHRKGGERKQDRNNSRSSKAPLLVYWGREQPHASKSKLKSQSYSPYAVEGRLSHTANLTRLSGFSVRPHDPPLSDKAVQANLNDVQGLVQGCEVLAQHRLHVGGHRAGLGLGCMVVCACVCVSRKIERRTTEKSERAGERQRQRHAEANQR